MNYANVQEPQMYPCDGRPATRGWGPVVVQVDLRWAGSQGLPLGAVGQRMANAGRDHFAQAEATGHVEGKWTRRQSNGTTATAQLAVDAIGSNWTMIAKAPPVGKQTSGCQGPGSERLRSITMVRGRQAEGRSRTRRDQVGAVRVHRQAPRSLKQQ